MSAMGPTMMLVIAIAGLAIFTPLMLAYAARTYLVVLTYSMTGEDRFRWPRDPFTDYMHQGLPLIGALVFWASLTGMIVGPLALALPFDWVLVLALVVLYVILPIGVAGM